MNVCVCVCVCVLPSDVLDLLREAFSILCLAMCIYLSFRRKRRTRARRCVCVCACCIRVFSHSRARKNTHMVMLVSLICPYRNKIGAELHIYLEEGTYHKRLFRGTSTNDTKK